MQVQTVVNQNDLNRAILGVKLQEWTRNATANVQTVRRRGKGIGSIEGILKGNAILILGPGPSLELVAPYLGHCTSGRLGLLACNSTLNPIVARGVVPDFVVAYDANEEVGRQVEEYVAYAPKELVQQTRLICPVTIHPRVVEAWTGEIIWFRLWEETTPETTTYFHTLQAMYPEIGHVGNLSCVMTCSLALADYVGADPIFSCGYDLPLTKEASYGAVRYELKRDPDGQQIPPKPLPGQLKEITDNMILTHRTYLASFLWTTRQITGRYYNLSPLASFRDQVATLPPGIVAGTWSKADGAD